MFNYFKKKRAEKLKAMLYFRIRKFLVFDRDYVGSIKYVDGKDIKSQQCHQNNRCHNVARTMANANSNLKVVPCLIVGNQPIVHFINYDIENECHIDNTLGIVSNEYKYYLFNCDRWIDMETYKDTPWEALEAMKRDVLNRFLDSEKDVEFLIEFYGMNDVI